MFEIQLFFFQAVLSVFTTFNLFLQRDAAHVLEKIKLAMRMLISDRSAVQTSQLSRCHRESHGFSCDLTVEASFLTVHCP